MVCVLGIARGIHFTEKEKNKGFSFGGFGIFLERLDENYEDHMKL
jgi:hypothetical protein